MMDTERLAQLLQATREGDRVAAQALADYLEENDLKDVVREGLTAYEQAVSRRLMGRGVLPRIDLRVQMKCDIQAAVNNALGRDLDQAFEEVWPHNPAVSALIAQADGLEWRLTECDIGAVFFDDFTCTVRFIFTLNGYRPASGPEREIGRQIDGYATLEILPDSWEFTDVKADIMRDEDDDGERKEEQ
jgi:hypothetical protein